MCNMFYECSSLKKLNLSNFNTENVKNMRCMFYGCSALEEINLDIFHFNDATNMSKMFNGCTDEIKRKIQNKMIKIECPFKEIETSKSYFKIKK